MELDLKNIINKSIHAPSGENCQPWKFEIQDNIIYVYNIPEADQSLYNYKQRGSYVAHGALIENICISSAEYGYKAVVSIFPNPQNQNLVSKITLEKADIIKDELFNYIEKRVTNRKEYSGQKLSFEQKNTLEKSAKELGIAEIHFCDDSNAMKKLGNDLAVNEYVIFQNKALHDFFYSHILWKEEDQHKAGGFYIKTLEFLPQQLKGVQLFKNWRLLNILSKVLPISKMIATDNAKRYSTSGTIALFAIHGNSDKDFVETGRTVQRVWLTATKLGLAVHPCTGVLYFKERLLGGDTTSFSEKHTKMIETAYSNIIKTFNVEGKTIPMLFRIGYADEPSAKAMRMEPKILYK